MPLQMLGTELAKRSDALFRSIPPKDKSYVTVAVTKMNGNTVIAINGRAPTTAVKRLQAIAKANGWIMAPHNPSLPPGVNHAEQILYNFTGGKATSIGVSHVDGPKDYCIPFFNGTGVEISYTGVWK
ncbi:MAG: hypothetical protein KDE31_29775 [Caldilineaceae bacterium]|nr:hypothetical protein [Caldilineaceae bacterium]